MMVLKKIKRTMKLTLMMNLSRRKSSKRITTLFSNEYGLQDSPYCMKVNYNRQYDFVSTILWLTS